MDDSRCQCAWASATVKASACDASSHGRGLELFSFLLGVGSYRLNDREVTGEVYENTLKQIGVLVKVSRNS